MPIKYVNSTANNFYYIVSYYVCNLVLLMSLFDIIQLYKLSAHLISFSHYLLQEFARRILFKVLKLLPLYLLMPSVWNAGEAQLSVTNEFIYFLSLLWTNCFILLFYRCLHEIFR